MFITFFSSNGTALSNQPGSVLGLLTYVNIAKENKMLKTFAAVIRNLEWLLL